MVEVAHPTKMGDALNFEFSTRSRKQRIDNTHTCTIYIDQLQSLEQTTIVLPDELEIRKVDKPAARWLFYLGYVLENYTVTTLFQMLYI